ncbi:MAG: sodium/proline symporter PutP [Cardiobacteriaceae bacterium]|nr:sodium/proline symporter PutP [Cardiobacteriaceae bacterium]
MGNFNPMLVTFTVYLITVLLIGIAAYYATHNFGDYILGGRKLGGFVTGMSAGASDMSGWLLMGLPGAVYAAGLCEIWIAIGLTVGAYLNWIFVSGRLRTHTEFNNNALTLPEYFANRFGGEHDKALKVISATIILFFFTIYCSSGVVAGARLFENLFNLSYTQAMLLGAGATIAYTFIGGFLAVSWTDTIQASLMFIALCITPVFLIITIGGFSEISAEINAASAAQNINYGSLFTGTSLLGIISAAAWGLGYFGQPHILARFMAAESVPALKKARRFSIIWMILCLAGTCAIGYCGIAYFHKFPAEVAVLDGNPERIFIAFAKILFNPWIAGVLLSAILAAIMSTLSCQLLVCSSAITEDFYKGFLRPDAEQKELVWVGRLMVLAVAVVAIILAADPNNSVMKLVNYAWGGFGAAFGPIVLLSVLWSKLTAKGALAGMIVGAVTVVIWKQLDTGLYEIVPGFIACGLVAIVISSVGKVPEAVVEKFQTADKVYKQESGKITA